MVTLLIEHPVTDLEAWRAAFARFAGARRGAQVRAERLLRPADDRAHVVVLLDFDAVAEAEDFRRFLVETVWAVPENSPALAGTPRAEVLVEQ